MLPDPQLNIFLSTSDLDEGVTTLLFPFSAFFYLLTGRPAFAFAHPKHIQAAGLLTPPQRTWKIIPPLKTRSVMAPSTLVQRFRP